MITREEWLRHAVDLIDDKIFKGSLESRDKEYQIACGWCKSSKAIGETVYPYEGEDVTEDDFFPVTIHMSVTEKSVDDMLGALAHECIHAFKGIKRHGKAFKAAAHDIGLEDPITELHMTEWLKLDIKEIHKELIDKYGEFPGKPLIGHKKKETERKKNVCKLICPNCGFEVKAKMKDVEKYGRPTCACGGYMIFDEQEEENED